MLLTQKDVAKQLGVNRRIIQAATRSGALRFVQLPGHRKPRYLQQHVDDFLKRSEQCLQNENYRQT